MRMRATTRLTAVAFLSFLLSNPTSAFALSDIAPFIPPFLDELDFITSSNASSELSSNANVQREKELRKRGSCPTDYHSCATLAADGSGSCCTKNAICSLDFASQVACCPSGAVCTGTISIPTTTATTTAATAATKSSSGGFVLGGSTTTTSSTSFTSTKTTTSTAHATTTFYTNSYYNFPRIASTYSNSIACLSAYSECQTNYAICTAELAGGAFGVTISAENGGTTVDASNTGTWELGLASATSICQSLSSVACLDIQSTQCVQFGSGNAQATTTMGFVTGTSGAWKCGCGGVGVGGLAAVAAGVGIVGQMV